ncbi:uncharacterized protein FOMMEDRAFT_142020 [Fomitiporia mediterranea MF3/22]|uniref:uncharacterized protein n=1 Tax=Fomitiporia mediterranea (strain MF3/22) TaxID=694068 RepID=UPI0004409CCB|nr:uncharacterized protein FOMMEDRAFT_142020 [Fomitiporia mediterranea MF3/22]EJD01372.1 hypothetical protein FOMMEDRAFT_142020 [Fomitiporia mediterranea MF3/22]
MSNNADLSILTTQNDVEAHVVKRVNNFRGSLAALYDQAWLLQDPHSVFKLEPVIRDAERRISEPVPEQACILEWRFGNDVPYVLRIPHKCRSVYVRVEYCKMLSSIFSSFSEGFGDVAGYKIDISKSTADTETFPPHNPFENLDIKAIENDLLNPGVIVVGTPGSGKTLFLLYVLALRLLARQTTVLQFKPYEFLIFEEAGVFCCTNIKDDLPFLPEHTWFLVDSNRDNKEPPTSFLNACLVCSRKLIMAVSPRKDRLTFMDKYENFKLLWMQCCLKEEVIVIRGCQKGKGFLTEHQLGYFFDEFGPNVRSAYEHSTDPDDYREEIKAKLSGMNGESLRTMVRNLSAGYFETEFSHKILIAEPSDESRRDFRVEFASKSVAKLVLETYAP